MTSLEPGHRLEGRYELLRRWSAGGMGTVWLARVRGFSGFEKLFAVKTLLPEFATDDAFRTMFVDEARIVSQIRHGNVVAVEHLGLHEGTIYLALEWVQGVSWSMLIEACHRAGTLPTNVVLRIAAGACAGLHAAHELRSETGELLNVVHRDVSPQNILVTEAGTTKLIDFGIAKARGRLTEKTRAGLIKAKLEYASPEQLLMEPVDRRADVWALGVTLYHAFAGYRPFEAMNDGLLIQAIVSGGAMRPVPSHVPRDVAAVIQRALARDPAARFQTMSELRSAIEACISTPTPPETVAATLRALLGPELEERRQEIREALEQANRRSSGAPASVPSSQAPRKMPSIEMPVLPPELAQRGWADAARRPDVVVPDAPTQRDLVEENEVETGPMVTPGVPRRS